MGNVQAAATKPKLRAGMLVQHTMGHPTQPRPSVCESWLQQGALYQHHMHTQLQKLCGCALALASHGFRALQARLQRSSLRHQHAMHRYKLAWTEPCFEMLRVCRLPYSSKLAGLTVRKELRTRLCLRANIRRIENMTN